MAETFKAEISAGMSIITLGTIGLLVSNFIKNYNISADVSIFNLSTFCLILSGIMMVYNESIMKRRDFYKHSSSSGKRFITIFSLISNTLFDFGVGLLLFGVGMLFISQFETAYFIKNNLFLIIFVLIAFLILNYRYERKF
jgi:hypothetical protein